MTVNINAGNISSVRLVEQSSAPSTPTSGSARLYANNESLPKLSLVDDGGTVTKFLGNSSGSGTGITFPATQDASSNANTLDDYEEGTWTPVWTTDATGFGSINYNTAGTFGIYTKIGDTVYVTGGIATDTFAVGSASGNVQVGGLPYTANSTANRFGGICVTYALTFASTTRRPFSGIVQNNTTKFWTYYRTSSEGDVTNAATGDMRTGTNSNANKMYFFGFYQI